MRVLSASVAAGAPERLSDLVLEKVLKQSANI